jgi:hypothetical protein
MFYLLNSILLVLFTKILIDKYKFILIILLGLAPALQYNIGTDYFSYINILKSGYSIDQFYKRNEYFSYIIIYLIHNFEFHPQLFFIIFSFLTSFFIIKIFSYIKSHNLNIAIIVFIFIFATGIFHNQFNLVRNYLAIMILIYAFYMKFNKKNVLSLFLVIAASFFHATIIYFAPLLLIPNNKIIIASNNILNGLIFQLFIIISILLLKDSFILSILLDLMEHFFLYFHYLNNYSEFDIFYLFTKLYFVPLYIIFYFNFKKIPINNNFLRYNIGIWSYTWLLPIIGSFHELGLRIASFTAFFCIFPIYFLLKYCSFNVKFFTSFYIIIFYLYKIFIFAKFEYSFESLLLI